jgi:hypothetical protein
VAVYVFSLSATHGESCPAGPRRVLKIGKAGPRSSARFQSQHYGSRRAPSTLAGKLVTMPEVWAYLGVGRQGMQDPGRWIREHTDRDNFYLDADTEHLLGRLELFLQARPQPLFEGPRRHLSI